MNGTDIINQSILKLKNITLSDRQLCDIELILDGSFKPLSGFLNQEDYTSVTNSMRLKDGSLWPIPINLDIDEDTVKLIKEEDKVAL